MAPRKQDKLAPAVEHRSPIYLKNVSNFKNSLRRRDSQRFLRREKVIQLLKMNLFFSIVCCILIRYQTQLFFVFEILDGEATRFFTSFKCQFLQVQKSSVYLEQLRLVVFLILNMNRWGWLLRRRSINLAELCIYFLRSAILKFLELRIQSLKLRLNLGFLSYSYWILWQFIKSFVPIYFARQQRTRWSSMPPFPDFAGFLSWEIIHSLRVSSSFTSSALTLL